MKNILSLGIIAGLLVFFTGCTHRITDFTIISTHNVDLAHAADFKRGKSRIKGVDTQHMIIVIPLGGFPTMKEAIDNAIEQVPGTVALVDGVVYFKAFHLFIYGQRQYIVEGTPLIDPNLVSVEYETPYLVATYNEETKKFDVKSVSEQEYTDLKADYDS